MTGPSPKSSDATGWSRCQALAMALFARTDVLGFERLEYELTPAALDLGLGGALPAAYEIGEREFGRGERI